MVVFYLALCGVSFAVFLSMVWRVLTYRWATFDTVEFVKDLLCLICTGWYVYAFWSKAIALL